MKIGISLNFRQCLLEGARGAVKKAAFAYGDTPTALRLWQIAQMLTAMRDPEVADAYERAQLRAAASQPGEQAAAKKGYTL